MIYSPCVLPGVCRSHPMILWVPFAPNDLMGAVRTQWFYGCGAAASRAEPLDTLGTFGVAQSKDAYLGFHL